MADSYKAGNLCPLCQQLGRSGTLQLRQINAYEALWICDNPTCPYPLHLDLPTLPNLLPELVVPSLSSHATHLHFNQTTPTSAATAPNTTAGCNVEPNGTTQTSYDARFSAAEAISFPPSSSSSSTPSSLSSFSSSKLQEGDSHYPCYPYAPTDSTLPSAPNNAHPYPLEEYNSLQEELNALFDDDVADLLGDSPGGYYGYQN